MTEAVGAPRELAVNHRERIEVFDLGGDPHVMATRVETRDRPNPRFPRTERCPCAPRIVAQRCHQPDARYHDPSRHRCVPLCLSPRIVRRAATLSGYMLPRKASSASLRTQSIAFTRT